MKISAVILAGGVGKRFNSTIPKPFMSLNGKAVIQYSIDVLEPLVDEVIIVSNTKYKDYKTAKAGVTRNTSAQLGAMVCDNPDYIIIHDGARPFLRKETVQEMIKLLKQGYDCVDTVSPIIDGYVEKGKSKDKKDRYLGLTPEAFRYDLLMKSYKKTKRRDWMDEITMVQSVNWRVKTAFVKGEVFNSKITYQEDLAYAEGIMKFWSRPIETKPDLTKKTLVFGGSSGIGKECVRQLKNSYAPTRQEIDLSKAWSIDLAPYEAIIYSAGEYANESKIMKVNFDSFVRLVKLAEKQNWKGNIVALSSTAATFGRKGIPVYSASKSALNAYIESRHEELAKKGIYLNAVAPAKTDTRLQASINPDTPKSEMMTVEYVADYVLRYIDTQVSGQISYLRKGFDV